MVCFTEALEVDDFPLTQETDHIVDIRIVGKTKNIIIGKAGLLFCRQVLGKVSNDVAGHLHSGGRPRIAGGKLRVYSGGMVNEVGVKASGFDLLLIQIAGELMDQSAHHLKVSQFLCTCRGVEMEQSCYSVYGLSVSTTMPRLASHTTLKFSLRARSRT